MMTKENIKKMPLERIKSFIRLRDKFRLLKEEWSDEVYEALLREQQQKEMNNV